MDFLGDYYRNKMENVGKSSENSKISNNFNMNSKVTLLVFLLLLMFVLTSCGNKSLSGTYISQNDSSRKIKFINNKEAEVLVGEKKVTCLYFIGEIPMGTGVMLLDDGLLEGVMKEHDGESAMSGLFIMSDGLHIPSSNEIFVKESLSNMLKAIWTNHKWLVIGGIFILAIIGMIMEKFEERSQKDINQDSK